MKDMKEAHDTLLSSFVPQMSQGSTTILPGPVQQAGAQIPNPPVMIPLQPIITTLSTSNTSVNSQDRKDAAWKYEGYKECSKWMASDDDFFVFRRFESLNARVILWMQDRIAQMETRLEEIHQEVEKSSVKAMTNGSFRTDAINQPEREKITRELSSTLHHYNEYIEAFSKVRARPRAGKEQITNVKNWLERQAIDAEESEYIDQTGDLISVNSRGRLPIGKWLETWSWFRFSKIFMDKPNPAVHVSSAATKYSNNKRLDRFTNVVVIVVGLSMLLAPMWWLEHVSNSKTRLKIITGFICVFIFMMTTATINRPFEVVAATAAYAAVLMVFMQIDQ